MRLSEVEARGFRCFSEQEPLKLALRKGMNLLVGENESGKSAVIDAIRLVVGTRSEEWLRIVDTDFHVGPTGRARNTFIRCSFDELTPDEESRFLEWCTIEGGGLRLHVCLRADLTQVAGSDRVTWTRRSGPQGDGPPIEGPIREYLGATYLRPLRDAEREMSHGRRSRLSQILSSMPEMKGQGVVRKDPSGEPTLGEIVRSADEKIQQNATIRGIEKRVSSEYLKEAVLAPDEVEARLGIGNEISFSQILERLELKLLGPSGTDGVRRGLGMNNLLFMAAELLLLRSPDPPDQLPLLLIEEPEAHLHPQLQSRFVQMMERQVGDDGRVQVLFTTHSPHLAANADLHSIVLMAKGRAFPLGSGKTMLDDADYAFLRRFLDATKANLFFARGVLIVEGDAENLLLPSLAKKLGRPLTNYGVSIVRVGHTGFFRYSRILRRRDATEDLPVRVACIADRDIPPDDASRLDGAGDKPRRTESGWSPAQRATRTARLSSHADRRVRVFVSPQWTLEFDLALKGMAVELHQAIQLVRDGGARDRAVVMEAARLEVDGWRAAGADAVAVAVAVYRALDDKSVSKAEAAEQLARVIDELDEDSVELRKRVAPYLVEAIDYVTWAESPQQSVPAVEGAPLVG